MAWQKKSDGGTTEDIKEIHRLHVILKQVWERRSLVIVCLYVLGVVGMFCLPMTAQRGNVDEKALLMGVTKPSIQQKSGFIVKNYAKMQKEIGSPAELGLIDRVQAAWTFLERAQGSTIERPMEWKTGTSGTKEQGDASLVCDSVHSIVHASRSDGTESLLLAVGVDSVTKPDASFASILIWNVLAWHLGEQGWLAKNIILVLLDVSKCTSDQALFSWVNSNLDTLRTDRRIGQIQQAIFVDIESLDMTDATIKVHGLGGQLPNYDMYMIARRNLELYSSWKIKVEGSQIGSRPGNKQSEEPGYPENQLTTLARFMWHQAFGIPSGPHSVMLKRAIDSLSISLSSSKGNQFRNHGVPVVQLERCLQVLEMMVRTMNNLQEKLHHSTAFYALAGPYSMIEVAMFMVPPGILLVAFVLQTADLLAKLQKHVHHVNWKQATGAAVCLHAIFISLFTCFSIFLESSYLTGHTIFEWDTARSCVVPVCGILTFAFVLWKYTLSWVLIAIGGKESKISKTSHRCNLVAVKAMSAIFLCCSLPSVLLWRWPLAWILLTCLIPLHRGKSL